MKYNKSTKKTEINFLEKLIKTVNQIMQFIQVIENIIELKIVKITEKITDRVIFNKQNQSNFTEKTELKKRLKISNIN